MGRSIVREETAGASRRFSLDTGDTRLGLEVGEDGFRISSLCSPASSHEWADGGTGFGLPGRLRCAGREHPLRWRFNGADRSGGGEETLILRFSAQSPCALELRSIWTAREGGPVEHRMELLNLGDAAVTVFAQESLDMGLSSFRPPVLWRFHKENARMDAVGIYREVLADGAEICAYTNPENDEGTNGFIPCVFIDAFGSHGLYLALEWPHGRIQVSSRGAKPVGIRVRAGLNGDFMTDIESGGAYELPAVYIGAYKGDVDDGSNRFKRWFFSHKLPPAMRENPKEPLLQMDDQGLQGEADISSFGVDALKWDYGWWPGEQLQDPDWSWMRTCEGDWRFCNEGYTGKYRSLGLSTLPEYTRYLRGKGLSFTLYLILHDAACDGDGGAFTSVGPHALPAGWFTNQVITVGASADLGDTDCVEWLKERVLRLFRETNTVTYRSDFGPIATRSDKINRHKYGADTAYWCAKGFYELLDHLSRHIEGFRYENCGSGGSLKDYATLSRSNVVQYNDNAHYLDIRTTFYDSSYVIHPMQLSAPVNPDFFYGSPAEEHYGWRSVMLGVWNPGTPSGTYNKLPGSDTYFYLHYTRMYAEKLRPLVRHADLYHILPRPDEVHWDGVQYFDPDAQSGIKGAVFLFKPSPFEGIVKRIRLRGLCPDVLYRLRFEDRKEQDAEYPGERLLAGIDVEIREDRGSEIIWLL